jgi:hypothetical protein
MHHAFPGALVAFLVLALGLYVYYLFGPTSENVAHRVIIEEASYGESCAQMAAAPLAANYYQPGNATAFVRELCGKHLACSIPVNVNVLGDPVSGCAKDFKVQYRCGARGILRIANIPAEAHGQKLDLLCP